MPAAVAIAVAVVAIAIVATRRCRRMNVRIGENARGLMNQRLAFAAEREAACWVRTRESGRSATPSFPALNDTTGLNRIRTRGLTEILLHTVG